MMGKDQSDILDVPGPGHCSGSSGSDESVEMQKPPPPQSLYQNHHQQHHQRNGHLFENLVVLDHILETTPLEQSGLLTGSVEDGMDACSGDELFLLPESVLAMDSVSFREDVRSVAPSLIPKNNNSNSNNSQSSNALSNNFGSPHNSLDSTDSAKSLRLLEDSEGLRMARASQGCKTLWLCEAGGSVPIAEPIEDNNSMMSNGNHTTEPGAAAQSDGAAMSDGAASTQESAQDSAPGSRSQSRAASAQKAFQKRSQTSVSSKDREERIRRIREQQEEERRRKLEELKQHAAASAKFRESQEQERRRHLEQMRYREQDKWQQVAERRKAIEAADRERKEAMLKKARDRDGKIMEKRREQMAKRQEFAFGSSTPRTLHPTVGSTSDIWGAARSRSTSSSNMMSQSMYAPSSSSTAHPLGRRSTERDDKAKRATSTTGLDKSGEVWTLAPPAQQGLGDRRAEVNRTSPGRFTAARSRRGYTNNKAPLPAASPVTDAPYFWFVKDIDFGEGGSEKGVGASAPSGRPPIPPGSGGHMVRARSRHDCHFQSGSALVAAGADDGVMSQSFVVSSAARRRTDLMPTITHSMMTSGIAAASPHSRSSTPRTSSAAAGRAVSMSRLDLLSKPRRPTMHAAMTTNHNSHSFHQHASPSLSPFDHHTSGSRASRSPMPNSRNRMSISMIHLNKKAQSMSGGLNKTPLQRQAKVTPNAKKPPPSPMRRPTSGPFTTSTPNARVQRRASAAADMRRGFYKGSSRPTSALSTDSNSTAGGVRMRAKKKRSPRPASIAVTGSSVASGSPNVMTQSMIERRPRLNQKSASESRPRRARSSEKVSDDSPSKGTGARTPIRRTPAQVKADSAAKKAKTPSKATTSTPSTPARPEAKKEPSPNDAQSKDNNNKEAEGASSVAPSEVVAEQKTPSKERRNSSEDEEKKSGSATPTSDAGKKIITSEEEAKARLAEKRREMKEKMEREAELERQRLEEEQRLAEEKRRQEEEEERRQMEEAERLAQEAKKLEEERLQKAIEEAEEERKKKEEEERQKKEEEERLKKEREEEIRKAKEEAEKKQVELEEKMKKEEEERLARKKRIEEIMARTRGGKSGNTPTSTPKKEASPQPADDATTSSSVNGQEESSQSNINNNNNNAVETTQEQTEPEHSSQVTILSSSQEEQQEAPAVQLSPERQKPDLLGDIDDLVAENNERNSAEKGQMEVEGSAGVKENGGPQDVLDFDPLQPSQTVVAEGGDSGNALAVELDQVLNLAEAKETKTSDANSVPIIAFEEKKDPPVADLLS